MAKKSRKTRAKESKKKKLKQKNSYFLYKKRLLSQIRKWDDPCLRRLCSPVEEINNEIKGVIGSLTRILSLTDDGVGLSAPQIGFLKNVIAIRPDGKNISIMVNPEVTSYSDKEVEGIEGCLSFPGVFTEIKRDRKIEVKYLNRKGEERKRVFEDFEARIVLHEIDHLFGVCKVGDAYEEEKEKQEARRKRRM